MSPVCPLKENNTTGACKFSSTGSCCISLGAEVPDIAPDLCLMRLYWKPRLSLGSTNDSRMFTVVGKHHFNCFHLGELPTDMKSGIKARPFLGSRNVMSAFLSGIVGLS